MTIILLILAAAVASALCAYAAYTWPERFQPYSETLRNLGLLMGIVLLAWNIAVGVTVMAIDAGGLLVVGGFYEAKRIEEALVLIGPLATVGVFGGAWLYLAVLDRWVSAPRIALSTSR